MTDRLPQLSLTIVQRATWIVDFELANDDNTPVDLTGAVVHLDARHFRAGTAWAIDSDGVGGIEITGAAGGLFRIRIGSDVTMTLASGRWWYALRIDRSGVYEDDVLVGGDLEVVRVPGGAA